MTAAKQVRYAVRCADFQTSPVRDRAQAERQLDAINKASTCQHEHEIVEVPAEENTGR